MDRRKAYFEVKIFITGCARSGTTLACRLFYAFHNTQVIDAEIELHDLVDAERWTNVAEDFLVGKRSIADIFSNILSPDALRHAVSLIRDNDIKIVNCIRNGRDVVHKPEYGTQAGCDRWIACMQQQEEYIDLVDYILCYEDLIDNPIKVQMELASTLGLNAKHSWGTYPDFVPTKAFLANFLHNKPSSYGKRPISSASIGHDATDKWKEYCNNEAEQDEMANWLKRYETKKLY